MNLCEMYRELSGLRDRMARHLAALQPGHELAGPPVDDLAN
jgi:hypothetical protein